MGDVIKLQFSERIHADARETYRLVAAFVRIPDGSLREKIIALAEAGAESIVASTSTERRDQDTPGT